MPVQAPAHCTSCGRPLSECPGCGRAAGPSALLPRVRPAHGRHGDPDGLDRPLPRKRARRSPLPRDHLNRPPWLTTSTPQRWIRRRSIDCFSHRSRPGRGRHRRHQPTLGARKPDLGVRVTGRSPPQLVDGVVVSATERQEIGQIGCATLGPVLDVVDVGEFVVGAAGESTTLVPAVDLDALRCRGISARPTLFENGPVASLDGQDHLGVAREPSRDLALNGSHAGDLGHTLDTGRGARTTATRRANAQQHLERGVHDDPGTKPAPPLRGGRAAFGKEIHQDVVQPLVEGHVFSRIRVIRVTCRVSWVSRTVPSSPHLGCDTVHEGRFRGGVIVFGERHPDRATNVVETQCAPFELPRRRGGDRDRLRVARRARLGRLLLRLPVRAVPRRQLPRLAHTPVGARLASARRRSRPRPPPPTVRPCRVTAPRAPDPRRGTATIPDWRLNAPTVSPLRCSRRNGP